MGIFESVIFVLFFLCLGALIRMVYIERTKVIFGACYTNKYVTVEVQEVDDGDIIFVDEYDEKHRMPIERFLSQFTIVPPNYEYTGDEK